MRRSLEALLFASDQPLTMAKLASLLEDSDRKEIAAALSALREEYERDGRGFMLVEFGGGYSISTRPEEAPLIRRLYKGRRKVRLSKAALECLAIIAYKQPVTRLEIEEIRGVSVSGVIGTLMERDLIAIVGRAETLGHPLLYGSTKTFLDYLGLRALNELPQLSELEDLLAEREQLKQLSLTNGDVEDDASADAYRTADQDGDRRRDPDDDPDEDPVADLRSKNRLEASPDEDLPREDLPDAEFSPDPELSPEDLRAATGRGGAD